MIPSLHTSRTHLTLTHTSRTEPHPSIHPFIKLKIYTQKSSLIIDYITQLSLLFINYNSCLFPNGGVQMYTVLVTTAHCDSPAPW